VLRIIDDVSRECLGAVVDTSISGHRVAQELDRIAPAIDFTALPPCKPMAEAILIEALDDPLCTGPSDRIGRRFTARSRRTSCQAWNWPPHFQACAWDQTGGLTFRAQGKAGDGRQCGFRRLALCPDARSACPVGAMAALAR
jgi:hypothetical protein